MSEKQNFIFNQKCAVDLHLHLDGSISVKSARELAKIEGVVLPESDLELVKMLVLNSVEAAFLPEEEKQELRKTIEAEFAL